MQMIFLNCLHHVNKTRNQWIDHKMVRESEKQTKVGHRWGN